MAIIFPYFITFTTFVIFDFQTAVVPHVSLDVHHADFGQLQDPNAVAQRVQFFSLWVALETVGTYYLPKVSEKSVCKRDETRFLVFPAENVREQRNICFSGKNVPAGYLSWENRKFKL